MVDIVRDVGKWLIRPSVSVLVWRGVLDGESSRPAGASTTCSFSWRHLTGLTVIREDLAALFDALYFIVTSLLAIVVMMMSKVWMRDMREMMFVMMDFAR